MKGKELSKGRDEKYTTHNFLHEQGLNILNNDIKNKVIDLSSVDTKNIDKFMNILEILNGKSKKFIDDANEPDKFEKWIYIKYRFFNRDYKEKKIWIPLYTAHFCDPHTAFSFLDKTFRIINVHTVDTFRIWSVTADDMIKKHTFEAVRLYRKNFVLSDKVIAELSKACHYIEDVNETHHTFNKIAFTSNHRTFEKSVKYNIEKNRINSINNFYEIDTFSLDEKEYWKAQDLYNPNKYKFPNNDFDANLRYLCSSIMARSSTFAKGMDQYKINKARKEKINLRTNKVNGWERAELALSNEKNRWEKVQEQTLKMAQIQVAVFLLNFLLHLSDEVAIES